MALVASVEPTFLEDLTSQGLPSCDDGLLRTYVFGISAGPNPPEKLPWIVRAPAWANTVELGASGTLAPTGTIMAGLASSVAGLFSVPSLDGTPIPNVFLVGPGLLARNVNAGTITISGIAGRDVIFAFDGTVAEGDRVYVGARFRP